MFIVIRVDASLEMGTGHVMRCLTLAEGLLSKGAEVQFICRNHKGNLIQLIQKKGFVVHVLESSQFSADSDKCNVNETLFHASWLGCGQENDAHECKLILQKKIPDWLIVDHYSIDEVWQSELKGLYQKLMVIDDLADRRHLCDILLDQTYGRLPESYHNLVSNKCNLLLGSQYALLREEFSQWREYSLKRRKKPDFKTLLISMGGVDPDNVTGKVLHELNNCKLPESINIIVIMGKTAPHVNSVKMQAETMVNKTTIKFDATNLAEIMSDADIAIGAAGTTSWERCCLGVPSLLWVLAENQKVIAKNLNEKNIVCLFESFDQLCLSLKKLSENLSEYSSNAIKVTDGTGVRKVVKAIYG